MENNKMLLAIIVVAVLALIGRIVINKHKKGDTIGWAKLLSIFAAVVAFVMSFSMFDVEQFMHWYEDEATLEDAKSGSIAGKKAGKDIDRFAGPSDEQGHMYYALQVKDVERTGYYRIKKLYGGEAEAERSEEETESDKTVIKRRTSKFGITKNPENMDEYVPIYLAKLQNKGAVLVAMDEAFENDQELPVAVMRYTDEKLAKIALNADSTAIADYYFVAFDENWYKSNEMAVYIYKGIAGLIAAIVIALGYLLFKKVK